MKHKVSELEGALLDAAVAMSLGWAPSIHGLTGAATWRKRGPDHVITSFDDWCYAADWKPSINWTQGGPIIERERIPNDGDLKTAMRAYVASKFGEEVELP